KYSLGEAPRSRALHRTNAPATGKSAAMGCSSPACAQRTKLDDVASQYAPHRCESPRSPPWVQEVSLAVTARHATPRAVPRTSHHWKRSHPRASKGARTKIQKKFVKPSTRSP